MCFGLVCRGKASSKTVKHLKRIPEGSHQHDMMKVVSLITAVSRPIMKVVSLITAGYYYDLCLLMCIACTCCHTLFDTHNYDNRVVYKTLAV